MMTSGEVNKLNLMSTYVSMYEYDLYPPKEELDPIKKIKKKNKKRRN